MTDAQQRPSRQAFADSIDERELIFRQGGREFLLAFYAALRNLRLYPVENVQVQRALDEVTTSAQSLLNVDPEQPCS